MRNIKNFFQKEKEDYSKPLRECCFWSRGYTEHEDNGAKNKTLSTEYYKTL